MLEIAYNLFLIVLGFSILIFLHELGHFLAAKWAGIRAQAFAIGMGPVIIAWRRGIGLRFGSTSRDVETSVRTHLSKMGVDDPTRTQFFDAMDNLGFGETEYSIRWLPIGGFVSMLGQEDIRPDAVSDHPASYQNCPVWKRMIVVSAGVIMNLVAAVALFVWCFLVGVPWEAPIVGGTMPGMPAATALPKNAEQLGITQPGLQPGDVIEQVDGERIQTFNDMILKAAMARGDEPVDVVVTREVDERPLQLVYAIEPQRDPLTGLLSFGIDLPRSTMLSPRVDVTEIADLLDRTALDEQGVVPGMQMIEANGQPVGLYHEFEEIVQNSGGRPVVTKWMRLDEQGNPGGPVVTANIPVVPEYQQLRTALDGEVVVEQGLIAFSPLPVIDSVVDASPSRDVIRPGDVILRIEDVAAPRMQEFRAIITENPGQALDAVVLRDGRKTPLQLKVGRDGRLGVFLSAYEDELLISRPITKYARPRSSSDSEIEFENSPLAGLNIAPNSRIVAVDSEPVRTWPEFRQALIRATESAHGSGEGASIRLSIEDPPPSSAVRTVEVRLSQREVQALHDLGWRTELLPIFFDPETVIVSAEGSPLRAVAMGFERTYKFVLYVYLTIDRLFRGTVGIEQLRGPVGIVHIGVQVADRGFYYLVFLLAMLSVNLAVINFLPMPIVDGGLFLFLVYEKLKGRPPPVAFQNWATVAGLVIIAGLFLVVTYNDIARLVTG